MPPYFDFSKVLQSVDEQLVGHELAEFNTDVPIRQLDDVNFKIPYSKDGKYGWRVFQMIHPAVYVELVRILTDVRVWNLVIERFRLYSLQKTVVSAGLIPGMGKQKNIVAASILKWWSGIEQETIELALEYDYMAKTDILECYMSIQPSLFKRVMGEEIGDKISSLIEGCMGGRNVGIPQGSSLMDMLAELLLGYVDVILDRRMRKSGIKERFLILRYRDDYRIFTKSRETANKLLIILTNVLAEFGLKLNSNKTVIYDDILAVAIKPDKQYWEKQQNLLMRDGEPMEFSIQKRLLAINELGRKFPNAGSVQRALVELYCERIIGMQHRPKDVYQIISITVDIMVRNPRTSQVCVAILSKMLSFNLGVSRSALVSRVLSKAKGMANVENLEIMLQRLTVKNKPGKKYENKLCQLFYNQDVKIWNSEWTSLQVRDVDVLVREKMKLMDFVVPVEEVMIFQDYDTVDEFISLRKNSKGR